MRLKFTVLIFAFLSLTAAAAPGYEFHLLNGMVIKGDLQKFLDRNFYVKTDFGYVIIEADKLDYINVNESDGKAHLDTGPGMAVESGHDSPTGPEPVLQEGGQADIVPPRPLQSMSVPPGPLKNWSVGRYGKDRYTGLAT